jgi:alpha-beta hydrolase superfamily lysophospholipase
VIHNNGSIDSHLGGQLHTETWLPDSAPTALVFVAHGYGEHIRRYAHVAEALTAAGFAMFGLDHWGHGHSSGDRVSFRHVDEPTQDFADFVATSAAQYPGVKRFVMGHSMGSLIALNYTLGHQEELAGLILSGTAVDTDTSQPALVIGIVAALARVLPNQRWVPALGVEGLSYSEANQQAYTRDPLVDQGNMRFSTASMIVSAGRDLRERASALTLPILLLHGKDDPITPVSGAERIHASVASQDKQLILYENMKHEIMNEDERERVIADLLAWLARHS